ncbi:MFS general substrate transporter [Xylaria longipes]|nr:MFS general substrate transporter [Xylaria longipes]
MMLGDALAPAALIQVLENIICSDTYGGAPSQHDERCKSQAVQTELALVRGFLQMAPVFAGVLCTIPYTLLAGRIGRKPVLVLSGAGMFLSSAWVLAVCYFRFLPIRWVWLSGAFLFIGGGDPVQSSLAHVIITDVTARPEHAQSFLYLHAADVLGGFLGPAISAPMMQSGLVWPVLALASITMFLGVFIVAGAIPETLHLSQGAAAAAASAVAGEDRDSVLSADLTDAAKPLLGSLLAPLRSALASNPQALLLLCIFAPQTAARELFNSLGLQYSSVKFRLSYAWGNLLLSLFQGAQGLMALVLLPFITRVLAAPLGWSPWTRDRRYAIVSIGVMASGLLVIALAPLLVVEVIGLLLVSLGSCVNGLLMSLMGGVVPADAKGAIYSAALTLSIIARSVSGPVFSGLFVAGLKLGWAGLGLPFAVMAALLLCEFAAGFFIRTKRAEEDEGDH